MPASIEDEIVALRKELATLGVDAGAHTIHYHLQVRDRRRKKAVPSVATIWRVLSADRDVRVITDNGELLAEFTIDPTKDYQPEKRPGQPT